MFLLSVKPVIACKKDEYKHLKTKLKNNTIRYGTFLTGSYFLCKGAEEGVSAMLGTVSSSIYLDMLSKQVDQIEKVKFPTQLFVPIGTVLFETAWNKLPLPFDFDYSATLFGFFVYKLSLFNLLYDVVIDMLDEKND